MDSRRQNSILVVNIEDADGEDKEDDDEVEDGTDNAPRHCSSSNRSRTWRPTALIEALQRQKSKDDVRWCLLEGNSWSGERGMVRL